jgi:hypothetical protein
MSSGVRNLEDDAYDTSVYLQRARDRKKREEDAQTSRAKSRGLLRAREASLELDSAAGSRSFVSVEMVGEREVKRGAGFFCEVCTCTLRDSQAYMAHLNSRNHLANAGIAMKVERSSVSQVKQRFAKYAKKKPTASLVGKRRAGAALAVAGAAAAATHSSSSTEDEPQKKRARVGRDNGGGADILDAGAVSGKKEAGDRDTNGEAEEGGGAEEEEEDDSDFMKMMGFSGFGTSKK